MKHGHREKALRKKKKIRHEQSNYYGNYSNFTTQRKTSTEEDGKNK